MKFELEVADRLRSVEIRKQSDGYRVSVDGVERLVDIVRVNRSAWSLLLRDDNGVRAVEATVTRRPGSVGLDVHVDGFQIPVQPKDGLGRRARGAVGAQGSGTQRVLAPMPGKVVRVLVKPGDAVKLRQGLVVVEAMKMENELRAAREGRVREVLVSEGQSVEAGAALVVVE